jgi:hypothetical protein
VLSFRQNKMLNSCLPQYMLHEFDAAMPERDLPSRALLQRCVSTPFIR